MKLLFSLLLVVCLKLGIAGGFHFPDEDYAYAKVYYFNLGEIRTMPDFDIYTDEGGWAASMVDPNITSEHGLAENMEKLFLYGADGLLTGLSKCFIPRHGLVYFDENDQPVASLSICFECTGISMWTKSKGRIEPQSTGSVKRAENQIGTLQTFIEKEGVVVSENPEDYEKVRNTIELNRKFDELVEQKTLEMEQRIDKKKHTPSITIELSQLDQDVVNTTYQEVMQWNQKGTFVEDINVEYSAGGEKYEFAELLMDDGTHLMFDGPEPTAKMVEAKILNEDVILPNGIRIGSALEDVVNTFHVYNNLPYPDHLEVKVIDRHNSILYYLEDSKVKSIRIECYVH